MWCRSRPSTEATPTPCGRERRRPPSPVRSERRGTAANHSSELTLGLCHLHLVTFPPRSGQPAHWSEATYPWHRRGSVRGLGQGVRKQYVRVPLAHGSTRAPPSSAGSSVLNRAIRLVGNPPYSQSRPLARSTGDAARLAVSDLPLRRRLCRAERESGAVVGAVSVALGGTSEPSESPGGRSGRPRDGGRIHSSASGAAIVPGQVDPRRKAVCLRRRLDEIGRHSIEHQLGSSEHLELTVCADVAPCEVDESLASLALYGGSAKIVHGVASHDLDVDLPTRLELIGSEQLTRVAPHLDPDMHVLHDGAIGSAEHAPRQVDAGNRDAHTPMMPAPRTTWARICHFGSVCGRASPEVSQNARSLTRPR